MAELHLYYDLLSQPCRAVMFLDANKIPYESVVVKLTGGKYLHNHACVTNWLTTATPAVTAVL